VEAVHVDEADLGEVEDLFDALLEAPLLGRRQLGGDHPQLGPLPAAFVAAEHHLVLEHRGGEAGLEITQLVGVIAQLEAPLMPTGELQGVFSSTVDDPGRKSAHVARVVADQRVGLPDQVGDHYPAVAVLIRIDDLHVDHLRVVDEGAGALEARRLVGPDAALGRAKDLGEVFYAGVLTDVRALGVVHGRGAGDDRVEVELLAPLLQGAGQEHHHVR
jgi:hypothetical protein